MKPLLLILDTGLMPARWNVAMTAALAEAYTADGSGGSIPTADTVRFHRYPAAVLLGAGQDMQSAADVAYCRAQGVEMARRVTGGGAVYMSPGMLAWDVLLDRRAHRGDLAALTQRVCTGVAAGLGRLGVPARFRAPGDIAIGGRKVSGSAGFMAGRVAVLQGTVLMNDDVPEMARALRLSEAGLRDRVTCLAAETGMAPALPSVIDAIATGLADALDRVPVPAPVRDDVVALCNRLLSEEIGTDIYVAGRVAAPM
jgi:lipoate-protein ligase A